MMTEAIRRVRHMEQCFDALREMAAENPEKIDRGLLAELLEYYEGGQWLKDHALDEQGQFPADLKRGVLSEDGVYNFLAEYGL